MGVMSRLTPAETGILTSDDCSCKIVGGGGLLVMLIL